MQLDSLPKKVNAIKISFVCKLISAIFYANVQLNPRIFLKPMQDSRCGVNTNKNIGWTRQYVNYINGNIKAPLSIKIKAYVHLRLLLWKNERKLCDSKMDNDCTRAMLWKYGTLLQMIHDTSFRFIQKKNYTGHFVGSIFQYLLINKIGKYMKANSHNRNQKSNSIVLFSHVFKFFNGNN